MREAADIMAVLAHEEAPFTDALNRAGRTDEARAALQAALALNPWLNERHLAAPGGPLAPVGTDL